LRATSPAGNAMYEGRVNWSGELGYGVRQPPKGQSAILRSASGMTEPAPAEPVGRTDEEAVDEEAAH